MKRGDIVFPGPQADLRKLEHAFGVVLRELDESEWEDLLILWCVEGETPWTEKVKEDWVLR